MNTSMIFEQLFDNESSTYTYLLADPETLGGVIIDPVIENLERDLALISKLNINLKYTIETHAHADHITSADSLRQRTQAKSVVGVATGVDCADIKVKDGDSISLGHYTIKIISTPGHTNGCTSYYVNGMIFTGDTLFIRGTGRTDFQAGSASELFDSITNKLYTLPDDTVLYPGHDYNGHKRSTIGEEKTFNPRINSKTSKDNFINTMNNLKLPLPKKIKTAVPANMNCGKQGTE